MKQIVLDTNFILSCIRNKIDFFEELELMGFEILIPVQVFREIETLAEKTESKTALRIVAKNEYRYKEINLHVKYVDKGIIEFLKKNKEIFLATLDKELQGKVKNPKVIIRGKKKLEIV